MDAVGVLKLMAEARERELALLAEAGAARERALQVELEGARREEALRREAEAAKREAEAAKRELEAAQQEAAERQTAEAARR